MKEETVDKTEGPRAFSVVFQSIADGEAHSEASESLQKLLTKLREHADLNSASASGKMTIELAVRVDARGVATVGYQVTTVEPKIKRAAARMWLTKGGNLTPENPKQMSLGLRTVSESKEEPRAVAAPEVRSI